uniref:Uncharacterized protein n=1 Tax=Oryza brachyantha TaxID=4533 RepID=J3KW81_ORYBR
MMSSSLPLNTYISLELGIHTIVLTSQCSFHCCCESYCRGENTTFSPFYTISAHKYMERSGLQLQISKLRVQEVIFFFRIRSCVIDINTLFIF